MKNPGFFYPECQNEVKRNFGIRYFRNLSKLSVRTPDVRDSGRIIFPLNGLSNKFFHIFLTQRTQRFRKGRKEKTPGSQSEFCDLRGQILNVK